ncbi:phosphoglycerate dehydrogenase [Gammaproteobacteria bacterium]|nr:phosphoglycerate dehydrogenase [Gammaproteobacteria bacterium]
MPTYKTFNNIASEGITTLADRKFLEVTDNPEGLILRSHKLVKEEFGNALSCIARAGAGVNNIPIADATNAGIVVVNTPGANANAVKELVICGMLLSSRGIVEGINFSQTLSSDDAETVNKMFEAQKKTFAGNELAGKTLGIVGLGAIGSMLAQASQALGMKLIGFDPHISIDAAWRLPREVKKAETLEDLLKNSDYISLHVPLIEATKHLINDENLKYFKPDARLINLSRGGIVNSNDVIDALESGRLAKFVTDFPTPELIARSSACNDVILLPHLGASTKEAEVNCAVMAASQLANFLEDGTIINSVNFPNIFQERSTPYRLVIINKNEPGMISKVTDCIAALNLNIADMTNKSRDGIAINLIDLELEASEELIKQLKAIDHVLSVRTLNLAS